MYQTQPEARYLTLPLPCVLHVVRLNEAEHVLPSGAFNVSCCVAILETEVEKPWLTELLNSVEVDTDVLMPPISGIPNSAETETETPNDDDFVTVHEAELLKPCWNPSVTEPLVPVNLPSVSALSEIQVGLPSTSTATVLPPTQAVAGWSRKAAGLVTVWWLPVPHWLLAYCSICDHPGSAETSCDANLVHEEALSLL